MYKNVLENIAGIEIFPLISLIIFFLFFACMIIWLFKADKSYFEKMSGLPLEGTKIKFSDNAGGSK